MVVIPGRDRRRAVIMADHYDTAYMEDVLRLCARRRRAAAGRGRRRRQPLGHRRPDARRARSSCDWPGRAGCECDIWLVHLTGEEFPADCMGARHLCQRLVEGNLAHPAGRRPLADLARARVQGVYVLDMVAHNNDHDRDVFQICPGHGPAVDVAGRAGPRGQSAVERLGRGLEPACRPPRTAAAGKRSPDGMTLPDAALHPPLDGEIRPAYNPRSTLYNTDGQIFSDAGVPVVLFMENYDINRQGYHDTHDTMANIDLDYGSAVAAIAIESVARRPRKPRRARDRNPQSPPIETSGGVVRSLAANAKPRAMLQRFLLGVSGHQ